MPEKTILSEQELPNLGEFQRWMMAVVTHFGSDEEAWHSDTATRELSFHKALANVLPTKDLSEFQRIGVYRRMYFLRMREALEIDVPAVKHFLGQARFEAVVEDYFTRFPSTSYTLNNTGLKFPEYVRQSSLAHKEFIAELAELELTISEVMEETEIPPVSSERIAEILPEEWEKARFSTVRAFRQRTFAYPVHQYLCAFEDETGDFPEPSPSPNYVYIHRSDFSTEHFSLSGEEFALLELLTAGTPLAEAFETVQQQFLTQHSADTSQDAIEELQSRISTKFQEWMLRGVFCEILV